MFLTFFLNVFSQEESLQTNNQKVKFQYKNLFMPFALITAGIALNGNGKNDIKNQVKEWRNNQIPGFRVHIDDILQFTPVAATYAFDMIGMKAKTDIRNQTAIIIKSQIITLTAVYILKKSLNVPRPDNTQYSFPSGHTAEAFAGATIIATEFGGNYKWIPYIAYGTAATVGILRIANNKHFISDVLLGAGLGILSTKVAYWTHKYKWNKYKSEKDPLEPIYTKIKEIADPTCLQ